MHLTWSLLFIPLMAWADAFGGGALGARYFEKWPGNTIMLAALVVLVFAWFVQPAAIPLVLAWWLWRATPPGIFGGALDSGTPAQLAGIWARAFLFLMVVPVVWLLLAQRVDAVPALAYPLLRLAIADAIFATVATALSYWWAVERKKNNNVNHILEPVRGAAYGLLLLLV